MEYIIEENEIYVLNDKKEKVAQITYENIGNNIYNINHTFVDDSLRGQGIAKKLVQMAIEEITKKGAKVEATCSYAKHYIEKNLK